MSTIIYKCPWCEQPVGGMHPSKGKYLGPDKCFMKGKVTAPVLGPADLGRCEYCCDNLTMVHPVTSEKFYKVPLCEKCANNFGISFPE